jgi:hypothetical protein
LSKTKELKKRYGYANRDDRVSFWKPFPVRAALLSVRQYQYLDLRPELERLSSLAMDPPGFVSRLVAKKGGDK